MPSTTPRLAPSIKAKLRRGQTKIGNDGNRWQSRENINGVWSWKKITIPKTTHKKKHARKTTVTKKTTTKKSSRVQSLKIQNEDEIWKAISKLRWTTDYNEERVTNMILKMNLDFVKILNSFVFKKAECLVNKYEHLNVNLSDDNFFYLMTDVVARGKDFFDKSNTNDKIIQKMLKKTVFFQDFERVISLGEMYLEQNTSYFEEHNTP